MDATSAESPRAQPQTRQNQLYRSFLPWIACLMLMVTAGNANYTFGVFFKPVANEFAWSSGAVSMAYSLRWFMQGLLVVAIAYAADRYGPRKPLLVGQLFLGAGVLLSSQITSLWQLYLFQGVMTGIGAAGPFSSLSAVVARWFDHRRGLALGITTAGAGLGSVIFPTLSASLIEFIGWRDTYVVLGLLVLAIGVPCSMLIKDPIPSTTASADRSGFVGGSQSPRANNEGILQILKARELWMTAVVFLFIGAAAQLVMGHLVNFAIDAGISALVAAEIMSAMGVASTVGRLTMGAASDRIGSKRALAVCLAFVTVSIIGITLSIQSNAIWVLAVLFGLGFGGTSPLLPATMATLFGMRRIGTLTGIAAMASAFGGTLGPWIAGYVYDVSLSYGLAFLLAATFGLIAFLIVWQLRPLVKNRWEVDHEHTV